nr:acylneuraminate cytidylyltransferase family protein [uncultured Methanospirillum sp.]
MPNKKILGVITARGGSKRIPRKNIIELCGKPLIYYTIKAAKESKLLHKCIVSSDDDEIIEISKKYGADVPFKRPDYLSTDYTKSVDVLIHAVQYMEEFEHFFPDIIVILEPTSPLRTALDIDLALQIHLDSDADSVVSIIKTDHWHPIRAKKIQGKRLVDYCIEENEGVRRQDLPPAYFRNGAFYSVNRDILISQHQIYGNLISYYIMPDTRSIDINTEIDLQLAELLMKPQLLTK